MIELNQSNYTKVLEFFLNVMGYGYKCTVCKRRAKIIQVVCGPPARDWVSWECPKCIKRWNYEFKKKEIRKLLE